MYVDDERELADSLQDPGPVTFPDPRKDPVHFSNLRWISRSPLHYITRLQMPQKQTPAMLFGSLVHALLVGGDYVVYQGDRRGGKWAEFKAANEGRTIVTQAEVDRARRAADAVRAHPVAKTLLDGQHEHTIEWVRNERQCSSRLDVMGDSDFINDLKVTTNTHPSRFASHCLWMHNHAQLAFYREAAAWARKTVNRLYITGVEAYAPHCVTVFRLTPGALRAGERCVNAWWETLMVSEQTGVWPGYSEAEQDLDVPEDPDLVFGDAMEDPE